MIITTIKNKKDFQELSHSKIKYFSKNVIIATKKINDQKDLCYIGYIVTKRIGNAVVRNKIKRQFRHIIKDNYQNLMNPGYNYVIIAKYNINQASFSEIKRDIIFCLKKLNNSISNL